MKSIYKYINHNYASRTLKIVALIIVAGFAATLSAKEASTLNNIKVENLRLEKRGGNMIVNFDMNLGDLNLKSDNRVIYTPILAGEGGSVEMRRIVVNGRNAAIKEMREPSRRVSDAETFNYKRGASEKVKISGVFPYEKWMDLSHVYICEDLCGCGVLQSQARLNIGEFDNRPAPAPVMTFVAPKAEAVKARDEKGSAFVDYVVNKTNILPDYRSNRKEIAKIVATIDLVKNDPNVSITEINIHGYASPEGTYANNTRLAEGRALSLKDYVKGLYTLPDKLFTSNATPEDWDGLRNLVEKSNLTEKNEILQIIDNKQLEPDAREMEIRKRFPQTYAYMLKEWYPGLRHSDYTVSYVVRPFTIEETKQIMKKTPKQVSLNEMFLVAKTMQPGSEEFNEVMDIAVRTYPDDETANLNAACAALNALNWSKAEGYLKKAGISPEADHARGVLAMNLGNYDEAERYFTTAYKAGVKGAEENLKTLSRLRKLSEQNFE